MGVSIHWTGLGCGICACTNQSECAAESIVCTHMDFQQLLAQALVGVLCPLFFVFD